MSDHGIAFPHEHEHRRELGPFHILTRGFIKKRPVGLYTFRLPVFILIEAADADVADPLPFR